MRRKRAFLTGLAAGVVGLGADYIGHALVAIPLLPEQAGDAFLHVLPLSLFSATIRTLGLLARPSLLLITTLVLLAAYGAGAALLDPLRSWLRAAALTLAVAVVAAVAATLASPPSAGITPVLIEVVLLATPVPLAVWTATELSREQTVENFERRRFLRNLFYAAVGVGVVTIGFVDVRRFVTALATREGARATSEITPVSDFYVVSKNLGGDPVVDAASWRLSLPGRTMTYAELLAMPAHEVELTLECISNEVGGTLISNGMWKGARVQDLFGSSGPPAGSRWLLIESADGYTESFPLAEVGPDHLLATHLNGDPLTSAHGFPARFIFPGHYGMKQPKWVTRLRFSGSDDPGYWEGNGWNEQAVVKTMSRIDVPQDGALLGAGSVAVSGIAFAGDRGISAVEVRADDEDWHEASLDPPFSAYSWRFWRITVPLSTGNHRLTVRARDGKGSLQTASPAPTLPDGADGYHQVLISVA